MKACKDMGRDCELSTTGIDERGRAIPPWDVARSVMAHIDAVFEPRGTATWTRPAPWYGAYRGNAGHGGGSAWSSDCLRAWAPNGQCYYVDMAHVEGCTSATGSPREFAAQCLAVLMAVEAARARAEEEAPEGTSLALSAANADVMDPAVSWGSHLNIAVSPALWENLLLDHRQPGVYGFVLSLMAAAIPFFGAGYLLPMKDGTVIYSPSARAHHITRTQTLGTTEAFARGLLNSRREAHGEGIERLHLIGFDFNLISATLLAGFLQCGLAAAEEGYGGLLLHSPLRALHAWSFQQDLLRGRMNATAMLLDGRELTLPAYVREMAQVFLEMHEAGLILETSAPEAREPMPRIIELTHHAERGDMGSCARHLDWAAKLMILLEMHHAEGMDLGGPEARLADHDFASTNPNHGAFWRLWEEGLVDPLVDRDKVMACLEDGPERNRGWVRGRLIRKFRDAITDVDWGRIEMRRDEDRWGSRLRIALPRTDHPNRAICEGIIERASGVAELEQLIELLEGRAPEVIDPLLDIRTQLATSSNHAHCNDAAHGWR